MVTNWKQSAWIRDLAAALSLTLLVSLLAAHFEASERLNTWTRLYERWQLDELLLALLALTLGLAWFAYRRWRESRIEVAARRRTEERITRLLQQNRLLAHRLLRLQENERRSLARELHDELGQLCNAIKVDAVSVSRRQAHELPAIRTSAQAITTTADRIHEIVRSLLHRLRPPALDDLGLVAAVQEQVECWESRYGIACAFVPEGRLNDLGEAVNITIYRIVQESLNNVARHAQARHVTVRLARVTPALDKPPAGPCLQGGHSVQLRIQDDGRGVDLKVAQRGLGLAGMKERLAALGGTLTFLSEPGKGARVEVALPLEV